MKKHILPLLLCLVFTTGFTQQTKPGGYLLFQHNQTLYDQTKGNNPWGVGVGFQAFLHNRTTFTPTIELTGDIYLEDDKVLRTNGDSVSPKKYKSVQSMGNVFIGYVFYPIPAIYLSFSAGPSFVSGSTLLGIKPSLGFHFSKKRKWMAKVSFINVFNREESTKKDFGSYSLAMGCNLF